MPPPHLTRGRVNSMPKPGGLADAVSPFAADATHSFEKGKARETPPNTQSPPASVSLGRIHRKRPGDAMFDGNVSNKRRIVSSTTPGSSPPVSGPVGGLTGSDQRTPVCIDLTDDAPQASSSDYKRRVKSAASTFLDSPRRGALSASRYSRPLFSSTPTPGAKQKIEFIDLTVDDDSVDGATAPSGTRPREIAQSGAIDNIIDWVKVENPMAPRRLFDRSHQRPEPKYGQAPPANSAQEKSSPVLAWAQARSHPKFGKASRPDQLRDGFPGGPKNMTAPIKSAPAQEDTKESLLANGVISVVQKGESDQHQLRRGSGSDPRAGVQDPGVAVKHSGTVGKNGDEKKAVDGKVDTDGPNGIDSDPDYTGVLSKPDSSGPPRDWRRLPLLQDVFARRKPLPSASSLQGRESAVAYPVRTRNGGNGGHQAVKKDSVGQGGGRTELGPNDLGVSAGASQLQKPSVLKLQGQAEEQRERGADGPAEGSDEPNERGSTSLFLEAGRAQDTREEEQPLTPRSSRRRRQMMVTLIAPSHELRRISLRPVQRPEIPMGKCFLIKMPREIQDRIYRYLLLADDPIQVLHGWSKLYQRQRSGLHPAILMTCQKIFKNASALLYGQNVFRYMVRDRAQRGASPQIKPDINVKKYIPLFLKLELKIERSRTELAYCTSLANAINLLNRHGAALHVLTLDVSPSVEGDTLSTVGYFYRGGELIQALKALRARFIVLRVLTPETEDEPSTSLCRKIDMRTERARFEEAPAEPPASQLDNLCEMMSAACESPSKVVEKGWFEVCVVVPHENERRARRSRIAYNNNNDDDDDDDDDDGDDSGEFKG